MPPASTSLPPHTSSHSHAPALAAPRGLARLCFTCEGHLDLSWLLVIVFTLLAIVGTCAELWGAQRPSPWWWAWLGGAYLAVLIAAVPIAKARILASSRTLESSAGALGSAAHFTPHAWADGHEDGVL